MERIFDICHGCRRCVNLYGSFPTLFDLIDEGESWNWIVLTADYWRVVDQCYLCDVCYLTKCPRATPSMEFRFPSHNVGGEGYSI